MSERYQIKAKIGQGGIGAVYRAFDTHLQREVAVKRLLPPDESEAFDDDPTKTLFKEAHLLSALQHPNVVSVYDVGTDSDGVFVVMELVDGETFDQVVERGLLTEDDFAEMVAQTLEALIAAQAKDLVHRDIKPTNLMVKWLPSGKFQFKLLDFGLAKFSPKPSHQTIGLNDAILGSIHFMAPEQFERLPLDGRTDMYAMGCMYYYGLSGRYPFDGDTAAEVMAAHLQHRVTPLLDVRPDISKRTADWVMWLMSRDMESRPKTAQEALEVYFNPDVPVPGGVVPKLVRPGGPVVVRPGAPAPAPRPASAPVRLGTSNIRTGSSSPVRLGSGVVRTGSTPPPPAAQPQAVPTAVVQPAPRGPILRQPTARPPTAAVAVRVPGVEAMAVEAAIPQPVSKTGSARVNQRKSSGSKWLMILVVAGGLLGGTGLYLTLYGKGDRQGYEHLTAYLDIKDESRRKGSKEWVEFLVPNLDPDHKKYSQVTDQAQLSLRVMERLKEMESSPEVDAALVSAMEATDGTSRIRLIQILAQRNAIVAVDALGRIALGNDDKAATQALEALKVLGSSADATTAVSALVLSNNPDKCRAAESMLEVLLEKASNKEDLVPALEGGLRQGTPLSAKQACLRLLGRTGSPAAGAAIKRVLDSGDSALENDAISALGEWPDYSQLDRLSDLATRGRTDSLKDQAFDAFLKTLGRKRAEAGDGLQWQKAFSLATTTKRKQFLLQNISNVSETFALDIVGKMLTDSDASVRTQATQAKAQIERSIKLKGMKP